MNTLLVYINELYGLHLDSSERVKKGFLSENYVLMQGSTKYFLKQYRFNDENRIKEIHLAKNYFARGGIPVILPIENKAGNTFFVFNNKYYVLFPFIINKQLEGDSLTDTAIVSLGEMLGRIHLLGRDAKVPIKERFKEWNKEKALEKIETIYLEIKKIPNLTDFDKLALSSIEIKKNLIKKNSIFFKDLNLESDHLIHGDYICHNVFFSENDIVSHIFDFEKTDYSPRVYELLRAVMHSFFDKSIQRKGIDKARLFMGAYHNIYPVSKKEIAQGLKLFYLKLIHGVWVEEEHYLKNNSRVDEFLKNNFELMEYLSEHYTEFEKELFI